MVLAQQFPARPLVFAFSRSRHCRLDMGITQWINAEPGGLMVLQESLQNTLSVGRISQLHSYRPTRPNCRIYPLNYATRRSKKQRLCGLQYCLRLYNSASTSVMVVDQDNQESRSGGHKYPSVREQLEKLNIFCHSYEPGQYRRVLCPKCKGGSSQERSLAIFIRPNKDWAMWLCHRAKCGWTGNTQSTPMFGGSSAVKLDDKYFESDASNNGVKLIKNFTEESLRLEPISGEVCDYLAARQISIETLRRNGVMQTRRNNQTVIAFTYRKNGRIVNCKYRDTNKRFWQERHSEKILYGLDDIKEAKDIIIVEGEIDKLSMEEAGYQNCVSVPDGAPAKVSPKDLPPVEQDKKFEYLWNFKEYFEQASRIILATDADEPGQALAEELARRLGRERCWRVNWPRTSKNEICKDANEVLMLLGRQALREVIDTAELYPIRGLFRFSDYFDEIDGYYTCRLGNELGISTGWVGLDELYRVVPGELTIVTGVPNSGKSEWIDALMCNLNHREGWTFALCSMENMVREHGRKLLEKHIKKPFFHAKYGGSLPRMSIRELEEGKRWLNETFYLIRCEDDTLPSIRWVLNLAKAAVLRHGIRGLVIDPYNELDHQRSSNQTETEYVSQMLTKVKRFAQHHGCHVWFVAHPRQLQNWHGGAPSLYDISGSAHFINKCDNGIVVHRNRDPEAGPLDQVQILVRKVRNKVVGNIGDTFLSYNRATGEFADILIK